MSARDGWEIWEMATDRNSSPVERERDRAIERRLTDDGRPLSALGVVALFDGARWAIEILDRLDLLARLDQRGRSSSPQAARPEAIYAKETAAWVRGLPPGVCPTLFRWDANDDGTWSYQRGTIELTPVRGRGAR